MPMESKNLDRSFKDFEEELEQFFIRKKCDAQSASNIATSAKIGQKAADGTNLYEHIPLLICDVLNIDQLQFVENKMVLQAYGILFKNCLLHARVVGRSHDNDKYYKYIIDDSTASMEISIFRRQSDLEKILRLEGEVESLKIVCAAQNKLEISDCLRRLLDKAKHELNFSNIPLGSKILVYGKPIIFRGKVGIDVLSLFSIEHVENLEIEYKDLLIEWYSEKCNELKLNFKEDNVMK